MISMYLSKNLSEQVMANIAYLSIAVWSDASTAEITRKEEILSKQTKELTVHQITGWIQAKYVTNNSLYAKERLLQNERDIEAKDQKLDKGSPPKPLRPYAYHPFLWWRWSNALVDEYRPKP